MLDRDGGASPLVEVLDREECLLKLPGRDGFADYALQVGAELRRYTGDKPARHHWEAVSRTPAAATISAALDDDLVVRLAPHAA